jgi:hypothetical protein
MMQRMGLKRVIAAGVLLAAAGVVFSAPACLIAVDQQNGAACLKDFDCASQHCVGGKCIGLNGDVCQTDEGCASGKCSNGHCLPLPYDASPVSDTADAPPSDAPTDSPSDTPAETPTDSGTSTDTTPPPDTTPVDTGTDSGSDAPEVD